MRGEFRFKDEEGVKTKPIFLFPNYTLARTRLHLQFSDLTFTD